MKYSINTKIDNLTITSIDSKLSQYHLTCTCGTVCKGRSLYVDRIIQGFSKLGFAGCKICRYNYIRNRKMNSSEKYSTIYHRYKKSARNRGLEFTLSLNEAAELFSSPCVYCKSIPSNTCIRTAYMIYSYTGIDRLDNNKGYIQNNVVPCCQSCNLAKYTKSISEFLSQTEKIYLNTVQRLSRKRVESSDSKWEVSLHNQIERENDIV